MTIIYESKITEIGSDALLFFNENMMILFNDTALPELKDIAVVHEANELISDIKPGDELVISNEIYKVISLGEKVNETMKELGHCTIAFNGSETPELPGTLCVEAKPLPSINLFDTMQIRSMKGL